MIKKLHLLWVVLVAFLGTSFAQTTVINTSFEPSPASPAFNVGTVASQNNFTVTTGSVTINNTVARTGSQSLRLAATGTALLANYIPYIGTVPGINQDFYTDFWVRPVTNTTGGLTVNAYDLIASSARRIFVVEFNPSGKIRATNGSSNVEIANWTTNTWVRVSVKVEFATQKYYVAINGTLISYGTGVNATSAFNFRESYDPATINNRGTRGTDREFHSLRFNHNSDSQTGTSENYIDDLYVGTAAISDVAFGASSTARTITVNQPDYGSITLSPVKTTYEVGDVVTATLTIPTGYTNSGWTGSLSGTELTKTFTVANNVTFGANVIVDVNNPPAQFTVTVTQPTNGVITLSPLPINGKYYNLTKVTATINFENCFQFNNWTGDLSGSSVSNLFTVTSDMTIGANITVNTTPSVQRVVSTSAQFLTALDAMNPGDEIIVEDGSYTLGGKTIRRSGCDSKPIIIRARNQGMAILVGNTSLVLESMSNVTIQGFSIRSANVSTGIKIQNSSKIKITRNSFALTENASCNWIYIGDTFGSTDPLLSGKNIISYNEFDGKTQPGKYIVIDGTATQQSQRDTIMYNVFKNNGPRAANEKESIRVGWSNISKSSGFTVIMYNLFQDCDGDPEVVSIKSSDNIIKYNTFRRSLGTLSLRHGDRNIVEGNYFFGEGKTAIYNSSTIGCGGIRVYGKDHQIINNYFEGLTGSQWDATITITNGDVTNTSTSLSSHYLPENVLVAFNTLVNNASDIEIGFTNNNNYNRAPINCTIANNIVIQNVNPIVKSFSSTSLAGVNFVNNMFYPTGTATVGITTTNAQVIVADPKLVKPACVGVGCELTRPALVSRLAADSPAIDAATGTYNTVSLDFEGVTRTVLKDIGAHEYGGARVINTSALSDNNVGVTTIPLVYSYNYTGVLPIKLTSFDAKLILNQVLINWQVSSQINVKHYELEWRNDDGEFVKIATLNAVPYIGLPLNYQYEHKNAGSGNNYYRLKTIDNDGTFEYSNVISVKKQYQISVYPNPASQFVNINLDKELKSNVEVKLIDLSGVIKIKLKADSIKDNRIDISALGSGLYFLQIVSGKDLITNFPLMVK